MDNAKLSRRSVATTAATGLAALGLLGATMGSASAYQGNMERELGPLFSATIVAGIHSQQGRPSRKGHDLVRQAMAETQAGVTFAAEHGGGDR